MSTIQDVFNIAEVLNRDLRLQTSEADVTKGIVAYNMAKRHFEAQVAVRPGFLGGAEGTVATVASTESTAFPTGVLRIDRLQLENSSGLPKRDLIPIRQPGGHSTNRYPTVLTPATVSGEPDAYYTNGTVIYWSPLPNAAHTVRYYGFTVAAAATAAANTFPYPDICLDPFGAFVAKVFSTGLDDPIQELQVTSMELFIPVIEAMSRFQRDGASIPTYRNVHRT